MFSASATVPSSRIERTSHGFVKTLPWVLSTISLICLLASIPFTQFNHEGLIGAPYLVAIIAYAVMGAFVASRRPTNPIGWLQIWCALSFSVSVVTAEYSRFGMSRNPELPFARFLAWPESFLIVLAIAPALSIVPLLFPTGTAISWRWGLVVRGVIIVTLIFAIFSALRPGPIKNDAPEEVINSFGVHALSSVAPAIDVTFTLLLILSVLVGALSLIVRFRRGNEETQQQVKWVASAVAGWFTVVVLTFGTGGLDPAIRFANELLLALMFAAIPLSVGIAILRWRLYDIDLIVNRALVYGTLTLGVTAVYVLLVGGLGALIGSRGDIVASLTATGIVAVLFQPLRSRLQRLVDHFVYGDRAEPYGVLSRLGRQLEESARTDDLLTAIVQSIRSALKLPYAAIAIRGNAGPFVVASDGSIHRQSQISIPLTYRGESVGELQLSHRSGESGLSVADRTLLGDLARQIAPTVHGIRLMGDLQRSREQLVTLREEERRRLRHDLHDGLGPVLASLSLQMAALRGRIAERDPESAEHLGVLKAQLHDAVADIRRLVYGLRPPALDELGLLGAIREHAARLCNGNLQVHVEPVTDIPALPAAVEVAAYRIALESLTNVARHSAAREAIVTIGIVDRPIRNLRITIQDDGRGFESGAKPGAGTISMRERAAELGGGFEIAELPEGGVLVTATMPLPAIQTDQVTEIGMSIR